MAGPPAPPAHLYDRPRKLDDGYGRPRGDINMAAISQPVLRTTPKAFTPPATTHSIPERISAVSMQSPRHQPLLTGGASTANAIAVAVESKGMPRSPDRHKNYALFEFNRRGGSRLVTTNDGEHSGFLSRYKWLVIAGGCIAVSVLAIIVIILFVSPT